MVQPRMSGTEIVERGKQLYSERIRSLVETDENIGKEVSIDVETGDYEIGTDGISASQALLARRPEAMIYRKRIGFNAVYSLGGTIRRTSL